MGWPAARKTAPSSTLTWYVGTGFTAGPPPGWPPGRAKRGPGEGGGGAAPPPGAPPPRPAELPRGPPDGPDRVGGGAQRVQRLPQAHGDAAEDGRVAEGVGARLRLPQLPHEVEEGGGVVPLAG